MNYLIELSHPKHYYQFAFLIKELKLSPNNVIVAARDKDVLLKVLQENNVEHIILGKHSKSIVGKVLLIPSLVVHYIKIVRANKINIVIK